MRTILTLDPDVARLLDRETRRSSRSKKAVLNDALRIGLGAQGKAPRSPVFKVDAHAFRFRPGVDTDRLNQLVGELETEERARTLRP